MYITSCKNQTYLPRGRKMNSQKKVAGNTDLVEIGWNMKKHLDKIKDCTMKNIKYVLIENQISPIANRMKTIQGMLAQYFIMRTDTFSTIDYPLLDSVSINDLNFPSQVTENRSSPKIRSSEFTKKHLANKAEFWSFIVSFVFSKNLFLFVNVAKYLS